MSERIAAVTGASGFVGQALCARLRADGWAVRAVARASSRVEFLEEAGCEIIRCGLAPGDEAALAQAFAGANAVLHLAGATKAVDRAAFRAVNAEAVAVAARAAAKAGLEGPFVLMGSLAAAGPMRPRGPRRESDPPRPVSEYGASKLAGERALLAAKLRGPRIILRPGAIYGPREHEIFQIIQPAWRTGIGLHTGPDLRLQMTHVDDVVEACMAALAKPEALEGAWFIGDDEPLRTSEVVAGIAEALGRRVRFVRLPARIGWGIATAIDWASRIAGRPLSPFNLDKMREITAGDWLADSSAFRHAAGWEPKWRYREGMAATVRWYRQEGWLPPGR